MNLISSHDLTETRVYDEDHYDSFIPCSLDHLSDKQGLLEFVST